MSLMIYRSLDRLCLQIHSECEFLVPEICSMTALTHIRHPGLLSLIRAFVMYSMGIRKSFLPSKLDV